MIKKSLFSFTMFGIVALAVASSGGGGNKKSSAMTSGFTHSTATGGFSLKAGPKFAGSKAFSLEKNKNFVLYNTLTTYQRGNVVYILPYKYKIAKQAFKSNFNVVDLKFRLRK